MDEKTRTGQTVPIEPLVGWQPIETAPRDGTRVLVFIERPEEFDEPIEIRVWERIGFDSGGWPLYGFAGGPSLWMPLPLLPNAEVERRAENASDSNA